jgi:1,4-alpha-glucan branching enzyme
MGGEIGQWEEWNHDSEIDWILRTFDTHEGVRRLMCDLNRLYCSQEALFTSDVSADGFQWIVGDDRTNCVVAFVRQTVDRTQKIIAVANLTPSPRTNYRIGVPSDGFYAEILNTDAKWYGGSDVGNAGGVWSSAVDSHGYEHSIELQLPPLGMTWLRFSPDKKRPVPGRTDQPKTDSPERP